MANISHIQGSYKKTVLENGLRIVTETTLHFKSVAIGIWVECGSRFEPIALSGVSHFIEHMLFKGTPCRSAYDIAKEIDSVGGVLNAFTSKELTSFYGKVLDENLDMAMDLLQDIFLNASFPEEEIEREKMVVHQEIFQVYDNPEELIHEEFCAKFWNNAPLGQPILGTIDSINALDRTGMIKFKRERYTPEKTIIAAAGGLDHDHMVEMAQKYMDAMPKGQIEDSFEKIPQEPCSLIISKDIEQAHFLIGMEAPKASDSNRHSWFVFNTIMGGGMSSKLFQEIREQRGLAYSVYSFISSFSDTGVFGVYAGCDPKNLEKVTKLIKQEIVKLSETITQQEVDTAINQLKGNLILSMESSDALMNRLARGEQYFKRRIELEEVVSSLEKVTAKQLADIARKISDNDIFTCLALGPFDEKINLLDVFLS